MNRVFGRTCPVVGLIAVLLLAFAVVTPQASAQSASGTLVIYAYACPAGSTVEDADACRTTPLSGVGYTVTAAGQDNGVGATSDADGVASISLAAIGAGTVNVFVAPPAGYASTSVACSQEYGAIEGGITFAAVAQDAFVTCEWFFAPTGTDPGTAPGTDMDGTLAIQAFACPAGWDGADYAACRARPHAGVAFTVFRAGTDNGVSGTTDENGIASFPLFAADLPGDIGVVEAMPTGYGRFEVACTDATGQPLLDIVPVESGVTLLGLPDGAQITCAWFNIAAGDASADPNPTPSVTGLPRTGAGPADQTGSTPTLIAAVGVLGALGFGAGGVYVRHAVARRA